MINHEFTSKIIDKLTKDTGVDGKKLLNSSSLLEYINIKTKSANKGSKSRSSFGNLYALYVLVEDYIKNVYEQGQDYSQYEGAIFSTLFKRQRELPFGTKLQNHSLNHRLNQEYHKYFPMSEKSVVLRDVKTNRYWINVHLLKIKVEGKEYDISKNIIAIIDMYIEAKKTAFENFISACKDLQKLESKNQTKIISFIKGLFSLNADARLFEIASFSVLKYYYYDKKIFWGFTMSSLKEEPLQLYKTGRVCANDGGIDFVMRPLGYFFQVTETLDVKKYFLDIEKVEHYPIRFVVKTYEEENLVLSKIKNNALNQFGINKVVERYMDSIEEIITIPTLLKYFEQAINKGYLNDILNEILLQSQIEFNYDNIVSQIN